MDNIHPKTLQDLEFPGVLAQVAERCVTDAGRERSLSLVPLSGDGQLITLLKQTSEYLASFTTDNRIPSHGFENIRAELRLLQIDNAAIDTPGFGRIMGICSTIEAHKKFFEKFREYYPELAIFSDDVAYFPEILEQIRAIIDRFGMVRDDASEELLQLRLNIRKVKARIGQSFSTSLASYAGMDYLDEIRESVVDNRRVLAVKAMHRKKVRGNVMGSSKTGSIVYVEPEVTYALGRELNNLEFEEQEEVQRILRRLTGAIRPYAEPLSGYQEYLTHIDVTAAKARYAQDTDSLLPLLNEERELYLKNAYHPLLLLSNRRDGTATYPQTLHLHPQNRIVVISGPNAGGKSITLKTIGLLQVMLQSGLLVPVHERSTFCLFGQILTDIGDNQSIENHLSTYSYRLKNMSRFLQRCDQHTLFLIDEFGTGSDPELGGALAEAFLEVFYEREAYGVITTHYSNLKLLANELPYISNANMLFDSRSLEPTYQLMMGQAGSSFTFEVAQKNGIPYSLINKAKKKIERGKVRFDATIAKLQKERHKMAKTDSRLRDEELRAREENQRLEAIRTRVQSKLEDYQELYDHHQKMIALGDKVNAVAERYFQDGKKRALVSELLRIVELENSKRKKESARTLREKRDKQKQVASEALKEVTEIREKKRVREKKKEVSEAAPRKRPALKVGDRVRLQDGKSVGSIDSIEKNKAIVNYGLFTTNVSVDQLELVEAARPT